PSYRRCRRERIEPGRGSWRLSLPVTQKMSQELYVVKFFLENKLEPLPPLHGEGSRSEAETGWRGPGDMSAERRCRRAELDQQPSRPHPAWLLRAALWVGLTASAALPMKGRERRRACAQARSRRAASDSALLPERRLVERAQLAR